MQRRHQASNRPSLFLCRFQTEYIIAKHARIKSRHFLVVVTSCTLDVESCLFFVTPASSFFHLTLPVLRTTSRSSQLRNTHSNIIITRLFSCPLPVLLMRFPNLLTPSIFSFRAIQFFFPFLSPPRATTELLLHPVSLSFSSSVFTKTNQIPFLYSSAKAKSWNGGPVRK